MWSARVLALHGMEAADSDALCVVHAAAVAAAAGFLCLLLDALPVASTQEAQLQIGSVVFVAVCVTNRAKQSMCRLP